jgi:hypothetical protein
MHIQDQDTTGPVWSERCIYRKTCFIFNKIFHKIKLLTDEFINHCPDFQNLKPII